MVAGMTMEEVFSSMWQYVFQLEARQYLDLNPFWKEVLGYCKCQQQRNLKEVIIHRVDLWWFLIGVLPV